MDQALRYFRDTNDFDSTVLIKIYKFIKEGINKNNFISEHDLMLAIQLLDTKSDEQFLNISISAYSSIILNTCMESFISASGTFLFKLHKNILSEDDFMNTISTSLRERFQPSIVKDLANKLDRYRKRSSLLTIQDRNIINNSKQRINAIEKSEPIVELMAKLRKLGMDMLFPLKAHDKVLACIFISASVLKKPVAHRELIDLVIDVKESSLFSDFEDVSKTKIRGLLALLKHSQILEPYLFEEDPVKLKLVDSIQSFTMLRKIHDKFLLSFISDNNIRFPNNLLKEIVWPLSDEGARRSLLGDVEVFIHDVKAYFAWHRQIAATAAGEASRLAVMENNKRPSGHFMAPITSASYLPKFVGNADLAVRDLGSISNSRVPPLTIQLPVYSSTLHSPTATLLSDRTSTEGSNSLSQSPRAFSGYSPRATSFASTWDSVPNSVLGGEFHSPRSVGSASWTDPRAVGPSHPVSSREEFQSVFGTFSRQDDRIPLQPTQRPHAVPDTFSLFGNHDASFLKRPSEVYTPQAPQSSLPSPQHVPYQSQHSFRPPPVVARVQAIGPPHRELMLFAPSQPPQLPIGSRNNFPSMSILGAHLPVVTPTKSFDDRADSRVSCIGDGRPPAESLRGPFQVPETVRDPWVPTCSDNENHPSYLPGLGGSSNIWRMQNDEKKKPSGWSLF